MLEYKNIFHSTRTLAIAAIAISLGACSPTPQTTTSTTSETTTSPATSVAASPSPQAAALPDNVTIPGVSNISEVTFKPPTSNSLGFFDAVNGSSAQRVEVQKNTPIVVNGWAVLADKGKPADSIIITYGDNNSIVAATSANLDRPDVVKALNNPEYKKTGWSTTLNTSNLPTGSVVLKAWAYNADTKEATQISNTHEVVVVE